MKRFKNLAIPWDKAIELFRESILIQATITVILIVTTCILFVLQYPIPDLLATMDLLVLGVFFGSKITRSQYRRE